MATSALLHGRVRNPAGATLLWTKESGPGTVTFANSAAAETSATFSATGTYGLRLTATTSEFTVYDDVTVVVAANAGPTVSAGADKTGTSGVPVQLVGIVSDEGLPAPGNLAILWEKVSGPGTVTFTSATSAVTNATFSLSGSYVLSLTATDGAIEGTDNVTVTIESLGTVFAGATPVGTPGSEDIADVEYRVDMSRFPTAWWSAVTSDGHDVRVSDVDEIELPFDLIAFNKGAKTGFMIFKTDASGANAAVKVWAGGSGSAYAADDTYGRYNAYADKTFAFWPTGIGNDRTRNANHLTTSGAPTTDAGTIGIGATIYGTSKYAFRNLSSTVGYPLTLLGVAKPSGATDQFLLSTFNTSSALGLTLASVATSFDCRATASATATCASFAATWRQYAARFPSTGLLDVVTRAASASSGGAGAAGSFNEIGVAAINIATTNAAVMPVNLLTVRRENISSNHIIYLELMLDQATFFGTWGLNTVPVAPAAAVFPTDWTGYATATPDNPASTQTDFTFLVNLANMPANWWTAVTSDGSDIRVSDSANALIPFDLIQFSKVANTGALAFKYTKTTGSQAVRIWVRTAGATALAPADTNGRFNAYASHVMAFWPTGGGGDRTINARDLTMSNAPGGTVGGPLNVATLYNGSNQSAVTAANVITAHPFTFAGYGSTTDTATTRPAMTKSNGDEAAVSFAGAVAIDPIQAIHGAGAATSTLGYTSGTLCHFAGVFTSTTSRTVYKDGANNATNATAATLTAGPIYVAHNGAGSVFFSGSLTCLSVHNVALAANWLAYASAMQNQTTFWNGWSWV